MKLMKDVGVDVPKIHDCVLGTMQEKLQHERENTAWSPRALRINGWRYSGILDADLVTRAICSGFIKQPDECAQLLTPRDPLQDFIRNQPPPSNGMSIGGFA